MERIKIREISRYTPAVLRLYERCGWTNYTKDPHMLENAYKHSLRCLGAYDGDTLIGAARAVGDGHSILYIQDILVDPAYRRRGIGSNLLMTLRQHYPGVYQTVLMTDDTEELRAFYEVNGYARMDGMGLSGYVRIKSKG